MATIRSASASASLKGGTTGTILVRDLALLSGEMLLQTLLHCGHISIQRLLCNRRNCKDTFLPRAQTQKRRDNDGVVVRVPRDLKL